MQNRLLMPIAKLDSVEISEYNNTKMYREELMKLSIVSHLNIFNSILLIIMCFGGASEASFWRALMAYFVLEVIWFVAKVIISDNGQRIEIMQNNKNGGK